MMNEAIKTIMSTNLITVSPSTKLNEVRQIFMENNIHHIPVVRYKKLVGIITTYDLWKNEIAPDDYKKTPVSEVMHSKVAKLNAEDKIGTAAEIFLDNRFHALPVVQEDMTLIGIVTSFDVLLYEFKKEYPKPILFKHLFEPQKLTA